MKEVPPFPKIIPELYFSSEDFLKPFFYNVKRRLVATFFYKPYIKNGKIYLKNKRTKITKYMPLFNLTYTLAFYNDYKKTRDQKFLKDFKRKSEEMLKQITWTGDLAGWKFAKNFNIPGYPPIKESYSALFNGRGLSLLCRYYSYKKDKKIIKAMEGILKTFETESDKGGVLKKEGNNYWYLEYSYGNQSPVVYNGFISSLISLYETSKYGPTKKIKAKAKALFNKGLNTMLNNKDKIFCNKPFKWLKYDSNKLFFADADYYKIMLWQTDYLSKKTMNKELKKMTEEIKETYKKNRHKASIYEWIYQLHKWSIK